MIPILEDAILGNDLDCQNYSLLNIGAMVPVPDNLVAVDDPRLDGGATPLDGSVTNESVAATAGIDQSKLNMNGAIPAAWLSSSLELAAPGNLAEYHSRKGAPNGYAALDADGKIAASHFTPGDAIGSVTAVGLNFMTPLRNFGPDIITGSGTFDVRWKTNTPGLCWFGWDGTIDPQHPDIFRPFYVANQLVGGMVSGLPCSKFTSGVFARSLCPVARGLGEFHRRGMVPDPGATGAKGMYLGRDMNWHHFVVNDPALAHQPKVPDVTIVLDWWEPHIPKLHDPTLVKAHVTIRTLLNGASLFYRVTPQDDDTPLPFQMALHKKTPDDVHITLEVNDHDFIEAYASKTGYNNSDIEQWEVITPITDLWN